MPALAEIEHEIGNVLAVADELGPEQEPVALEYLDELALEETEKVDGIVYAIRKRQAEIQFLKDEEGRIKSRRQAMENRLQNFKDFLAGIFQRESISQIKGLKGTLFMRKSASVEVNDVNLLPAELVETRVEFKPRKPEIKAQLQEGIEVPGARMVEKQSLSIR